MTYSETLVLKGNWTYLQHQFLIVNYSVQMLLLLLKIWIQVDGPFLIKYDKESPSGVHGYMSDC